MDGTPLTEAELDHYSFYCAGTRILDFDVITGFWEADVTITQPGDHPCALTVTDLNGKESALSNELVFQVGLAAPGQPTGLTIVRQVP